ncbi:nucleocapsid protein [Joa yellow blotch virus]|uniref:Nucleoprotein n=1 Tax=joa yellow blotch associated virus TaxID=3070922 RepID=A0AAE7RG27_9RHAB|nr:nucleocapsid protein [Joa yellow blotch virus]QUI75400.1 nucleocapsid protein [joa yellow blotch associated virus]
MSTSNTNSFVQLLKAGTDYADWGTRELIPSADGRLTQVAYTDQDFWTKLKVIYNLGELSQNDLVSTWSSIREHINNSSISEKVIGDIFRVAAQLRKVENKTVRVVDFSPPADRGLTIKSGLDDIPIVIGQTSAVGASIVVDSTAPAAGSVKAEDVVVSAPYICMALLRLMTKPVESFSRSLPTVKTSFGRFYGMQSNTVTDFTIPINSLQQLSTGLDTYPVCNSTMAWMMGHAEGSVPRNDKNHGFMRFLIFQHTEMRGMQIYKMILTALVNLPAITPAQFLRAVETPDAVKAIKTVVLVATVHDNPSRQTPTYWWKYGKYVEPAYFIDLSVGRNPKFAFFLACILNEMGLVTGPDYANPKNIKALEPIKNNLDLASYYEGLSRNFSTLYRPLETESGVGIGIAMQMGGAAAPRPQAAKRTTTDNQNPPPKRTAVQPPANTQPPPATPTSAATPVDAMNAAIEAGLMEQL